MERNCSMYTSVDVLAGGVDRLEMKNVVKQNGRRETYFFISAVRTDGKFCKRSSSLVMEEKMSRRKI